MLDPGGCEMKLDDLELSWNAKESLAGKVALVTGASSGIGASISRKLAKRGAYVALVARRRERLDELVQDLHKEELYEVLAVPADIQLAEVRAFTSKVLPLHPDDVAEAALYALEQTEHVNIPELTIMPSRQSQRFK
ncbi:SDR family NAD(P)-dependent oxidoreductase [Paenibacillus sp. 2TAB26]|uniref:SDR family oxidoreductase n=1 Tax=Paenibacillus sp. 2TAB26 TaxID=3233005 RepID=UPI003F9D2930